MYELQRSKLVKKYFYFKGLLQKLMAKEIPKGKNVKKLEKSEENSVKKMLKIGKFWL